MKRTLTACMMGILLLTAFVGLAMAGGAPAEKFVEDAKGDVTQTDLDFNINTVKGYGEIDILSLSYEGGILTLKFADEVADGATVSMEFGNCFVMWSAVHQSITYGDGTSADSVRKKGNKIVAEVDDSKIEGDYAWASAMFVEGDNTYTDYLYDEGTEGGSELPSEWDEPIVSEEKPDYSEDGKEYSDSEVYLEWEDGHGEESPLDQWMPEGGHTEGHTNGHTKGHTKGHTDGHTLGHSYKLFWGFYHWWE